eukprot:GSChrysophyteH2.ASY1.ANO1.701.1 assembled CDS
MLEAPIRQLLGVEKNLKKAIWLDADEDSARKFVLDVMQLVQSQPAGTYDTGRCAIDVEIVFRKIIQILSNADEKSNTGGGTSKAQTQQVFDVVHFAALLALQTANTALDGIVSLRKLPFLLLEDYLDGQAVAGLAPLWSALVTPLAPLLTQSALFADGKNLLLRICKSLLRRLSRNCDTTLCGRIKMFLASSFPVNDPSAINLAGRVNADHRTTYELDAAIYKNSLSNTSAAGSVNLDEPISHDEYASFWALQDYMVQEAKDTEPLKLLESCKNALSLLEEYAVASNSSNGIKSSSANSSANTSGGAGDLDDNEKMTKKKSKKRSQSDSKVVDPATATATIGAMYLTSPDLLPLQLRDVGFRQQVALQVVIACQSQRLHHGQLAAKAAVEESAKGNTDATTGVNADGKTYAMVAQSVAPAVTAAKSKSATTTAAVDPRNPIAFDKWLAGQLRSIEDRCFRVVSSSSDGEIIAETAKRVFRGEMKWADWKKMQCPSLARTAVASSVLYDVKAQQGLQDVHLDESFASSFSFPKKDSALVAQKAMALEASVPTFEAHVEEFVEAEDPDNGIEDEYHPRHNNAYCWRALRLLKQKHLDVFRHMKSGDLREGLKFARSDADIGSMPEVWIPIVTPIPEVVEATAPSPAPAPEAEIEATGNGDKTAVEGEVVSHNAGATKGKVGKGVGAIEGTTARNGDKNADSNDVKVQVKAEEVAGDGSANESTSTVDAFWLHCSQFSHGETEDSLRTYFTSFGAVSQLRLVKPKKAKKYALVQFSESSALEASLLAKQHILNDAKLLCVAYNEGQHSHVSTADTSTSSSKRKRDNANVQETSEASIEDANVNVNVNVNVNGGSGSGTGSGSGSGGSVKRKNASCRETKRTRMTPRLLQRGGEGSSRVVSRLLLC